MKTINKHLSPKMRIALKTLACYLLISLLFGVYSEIHYRHTFSKIAYNLGKLYFKEPGVFEKDLRNDHELHKYLNILKFTPPFGWIFRWRIENFENRLVYLGNNYALPQSERFTSVSDCDKFGITAENNSDEDIASEIMSIWK